MSSYIHDFGFWDDSAPFENDNLTEDDFVTEEELRNTKNPYRDVPGGFSDMCRWCPGLPGYVHSERCPWWQLHREDA